MLNKTHIKDVIVNAKYNFQKNYKLKSDFTSPLTQVLFDIILNKQKKTQVAIPNESMII